MNSRLITHFNDKNKKERGGMKKYENLKIHAGNREILK
jgi:hypothetical protein